MKKLLYIIPILFLVVGLVPSVFAVHPLPLTTSGIFDNENQTLCYDISELNKVTLDGNTSNGADIQNLVEVIRQRISNDSNMNIQEDGICIQNDNDNIISAWISLDDNLVPDPSVLGTIHPSLFKPFNQGQQQKTLLFNTLRTDFVSTGDCDSILYSANPPVAGHIITITTEHELGHFAGLGHFDGNEPNYPSSDTIMNQFYECSATEPTQWTIEDINQINEMYPISEIVIPSWIKTNAEWWVDSTIDDNTFVLSIQWLTQNGIIELGQVEQGTPSDDPIPDWIKNNAGWWADGSIDDETFAQGLQYLIEQGVIIL